MQNKTKTLLIISPIAFALGGLAHADWALVDDMEGTNTWTTLQGTVAYATDPANAENQVLQLDSNATGGSRGQAYLAIPNIANGTTGTIFFRVRVTDNVTAGNFDTVFGGSDDNPPAAGFGGYNAQGNLTAGKVGVRDGANTTPVELGAATQNTWYNVWIVANNSTDQTTMYYNTGGAATSPGTATASGAFRSAAGILRYFLVRNNAGGASAPAYIDDLYVDTTGANLTAPVVSFIDNDPIPDGMDDNWEIAKFGSIEFSDGTVDQELDGLTDLQEYQKGTEPFVADSDGDGLDDGPEVNATLNDKTTPTGYTATDPAKADSDAGIGGVTDGVNDFDEITGALNTQFANAATDPNDPDSDNDGMHDGYELTCNSSPGTALDPNDDGTTDVTQAPSMDRDLDGLSNIDEFNPAPGPNPQSPRTRADLVDTDADGYEDLVETNTGTFNGLSDTGTNPVVADTDKDGLLDGDEQYTELSYIAGATPTNSDPNVRDTDSDGYIDSFEVSSSTNPDSNASVPNRAAGFTLVEDFQSEEMVVGNTYNGVNGWVVDQPAHALVALEPIAGGADKVASLIRTGAGTTALYKSLENLGLQIQAAGTGTLFFQAYATSTDLDVSTGLSDVISPTVFNDFEAQTVFARPDGVIRVRNGGAFQDVGTYTIGTWMNVWVVANNDTDTMKVYIQSPVGQSGQVEVTLPYDPVAFRNGTAETLKNILQIMGAASATNESLYVDNFYIDPDAANLTTPAAAKPVATSVDFKITGVVFNGSGDLEITFTPGGAGYILTSSNNLVDPFVEETNATYDDVDTFTVPAGSLNPGKDFFRVEKP